MKIQLNDGQLLEAAGTWAARHLSPDHIVRIGRQMIAAHEAAQPDKDAEIVALKAERDALREALQSVWLWMENQADGQSKGGHATFDLMMLREQRDIVHAAMQAQAAKP